MKNFLALIFLLLGVSTTSAQMMGQGYGPGMMFYYNETNLTTTQGYYPYGMMQGDGYPYGGMMGGYGYPYGGYGYGQGYGMMGPGMMGGYGYPYGGMMGYGYAPSFFGIGYGYSSLLTWVVLLLLGGVLGYLLGRRSRTGS